MSAAIRILLVDDEASFRDGVAANLRLDGFEAEVYESPASVPLETLGNVDLVITDYQMDGEDGVQFADRVHGLYPTVPILLVTAFWSQALSRQIQMRKHVQMVQKPLDYFNLLDRVRRLTETDGA